MGFVRLPRKRERPRSNILRGPQREWPQHRRWIRGRECSTPSAMCSGRIECAHARHETDGGTALKPADWWTLPLCNHHHWLQHYIGEVAFEAKFRIDLKAIALGLARQSPDLEMRAAAREAGVI